MEGNHSAATGQTKSEDSWTCNRCGWVYPNPHPSAKHRRNHKKHCGKIKGFEIRAEHHNGGSSGEASSDDDHGKEGVEHNSAKNQVESLALSSETEKPISILLQSDAKPDQTFPTTPLECQPTLSKEHLSHSVSHGNATIEISSEFPTAKHDASHSSDIKAHTLEESVSCIPVSTSNAPGESPVTGLTDKISPDKGHANEPSQIWTPTHNIETIVPLEISETAIHPDLPNIDPAKAVMLANSDGSDIGSLNKISCDAVMQGEVLQSDKVVEGNLSQVPTPRDAKETTEPAEIIITPTILNVDLSKRATAENGEQDSSTVLQEQSPYTDNTLKENRIAGAVPINETTEPVGSSDTPVSSGTRSGAVIEHPSIDNNLQDSEVKITKQGLDVTDEQDTAGCEVTSEQNSQSFPLSKSEAVAHNETCFTSTENYQQGASPIEQGSDNGERTSTQSQETATVKKDLIVLGSEKESVPVQQVDSLLDVERIKETADSSRDVEGKGILIASQYAEGVVIEGVNLEKQPDILETVSTSTVTVSTVDEILEVKGMPTESVPQQDGVLTAGRKSELEKESVLQEDNILTASKSEEKVKANQSLPQHDSVVALGFEAEPEKETVLQQDNFLAAGDREGKVTPNQSVTLPDNVKPMDCEAESRNQSVNADAMENSLKKSYSVPESSIGLTEQRMAVKNLSTRRTDSMDTEAYEDAPDTLEACSVAGSVAGSIEENDIFQSLSDTSARLDGVSSFREKEKTGSDSPENASYLAERTGSLPTKGGFNTQDLNLKAPSPEAWQESDIGSGRRNGGHKVEEPRQRKGTTSSSSSDAGKSQTALGSLMAKEDPERRKSSTTGTPPKQKSKSFWAHCICCATVH